MSRASAPGSIVVALAILAVTAYLPLAGNDFIDLDDGVYVTENAHVLGGLTPRNVAWAWTTFHAGFFQPLVWTSLQLDASLAGLFGPEVLPRVVHFHNLLLHAAATVLLFLWLRHVTDAVGRSAVVAALFAVHPLHVESVAWATERKDVLSTLLGMLTLVAYVRWVETNQPKWYATTLLAFALGLLAKAMLVTFPCVLLLLDLWPLHRLTARDLRQRVIEKVPLFALALTASVLAILAQRSRSAMVAVASLDLTNRLANAVSACGWYLEKTAWPTGLAVFYPHPEEQWPWGPFLVGGGLLLGGSLLALVTSRRLPALAVGWLWFLGTLVPVIGLFQVGSQAMADRFCYLPHVGLFIALVWGGAALLDRLRVPAVPQLVLAGAAVILLAGATFAQVGWWKDTATIWSHALAVTTDNHRAHANLAKHLLERERVTEAQLHCEEAVRLKPDVPDYHYNLGVVLMLEGENQRAVECFREALRRKRDYLDAQHNLALARLRLGQLDLAVLSFRRLLQAEPGSANALACLGSALWLQGERQAATAAFEQALRRQPPDPEALNGLGLVRLHEGRNIEALELFGASLSGNPGLIKAYSNRGLALGRLGQWPEAVRLHARAVQLETQHHGFMTRPALADLALYQRRLGYALNVLGQTGPAVQAYAEALRLDPTWPRADTSAAWRLATAADPLERNAAAALELAGMACQGVVEPPAESLDALAAAYAAAGRFDDAREMARKALARARPELAPDLRTRLALYDTGRPFVAAK
jgi:tetratricopeptide (TPR) repeat protein